MKKYKKTVLLTTFLCLIPLFIGLLLWNKLPDTIATHFDINNNPDGWSSKAFTILGLPLFLTTIHLFTLFFTLQDPKRKNISDKMLKIIFWAIPLTSIIVMISTYAVALGYSSDFVGISVNLIVGFIFIAIGNYMPKTKQNYTVGIKIPWTLNSEENWNKTHRFASKLWIAGGFLFIITGFFLTETPLAHLPLFFTLLLVSLPMIYSFALYKKGI
ncbi:SdpI family protein [Anaerosphaera multitolerans]|uniref:DUF1648 domain-containing protein n=1 Tax=Anaerosphaera multitolerans TaxID=2487351 RepID=A0A437S8U4_9FIRM|nr:SdpI family protein [Anaerosphaera multitolerans]RVU55525.1 DUF1648 domain-containing protein [Anaerosphaera multitolerans]